MTPLPAGCLAMLRCPMPWGLTPSGVVCVVLRAPSPSMRVVRGLGTGDVCVSVDRLMECWEA
jgi:hypothetical protein